MNATWEVGQTVLWLRPDRMTGDPTEVTVTKVGRSRVTVAMPYGRPLQFHMDTGYGVQDFTGRVLTRDQYAEETTRRVVMTALREEFGITASGQVARGLHLETWIQVLTTLREAVR